MFVPAVNVWTTIATQVATGQAVKWEKVIATPGIIAKPNQSKVRFLKSGLYYVTAKTTMAGSVATGVTKNNKILTNLTIGQNRIESLSQRLVSISGLVNILAGEYLEYVNIGTAQNMYNTAASKSGLVCASLVVNHVSTPTVNVWTRVAVPVASGQAVKWEKVIVTPGIIAKPNQTSIRFLKSGLYLVAAKTAMAGSVAVGVTKNNKELPQLKIGQNRINTLSQRVVSAAGVINISAGDELRFVNLGTTQRMYNSAASRSGLVCATLIATQISS
jgi:hypothetical protein